MLYLTAQSKILLAIQPVDFRKQIDGLAAICRNHFELSPNDGTHYVFINRAKTMIKVLHYDKNGYWLSMKRLTHGKYNSWPQNQAALSSTQAYELSVILKNTVASTH